MQYGRVRNIPGFRVCQVSHMQALHKVLNMPNYGLIMPHGRDLNMPGQRFTVSNKPPVLNMPGLRIRQGCEYPRIT